VFVARFPADGKNRTALPSAQEPPGHGFRFPLVKPDKMRNGAGKPVTELRRSLSVGDDRYAARRVRPTGIKVHRGCARAALFLSEATVKTHINHIFGKTGLRDRGQLVGYAFRHGLATPD
jgi:hypothetical protein